MAEANQNKIHYNPRCASHVTRCIPAELAGLRIDRALARMFPEHSRSRLAAWLRKGFIKLNARLVRPKQKVWGGESVDLEVQPDLREAAPIAESIPLAVVHEDESVLVVDKPAGLVVHPGSGNWTGTLLNALLHHSRQLSAVPRAGIVHRLDKNTSGLLVVAKTLRAQTALVRQIQDRSIERVYLALVYGLLSGEGSVESPIGRDPRNRVRMAAVAGGKPALTRYRVLKRYSHATLIECRLATGRTHQIRVHMHSIGHPLVGDPVYRLPRREEAPSALARFPRQALHASRLSLNHPVSGRRRVFRAALPADMRALLACARRTSK